MNSSQVDVVVPTFNCAPQLPTLLRSLKESEPPPHCVRIVDGGSTDRTTQVAKEFHAKVQRLSEGQRSGTGAQGKTGYAASKNAAIPLIDVPYVLFLDSDMEVTRPVLREVESQLVSGSDMVDIPEVSVGSSFVARARAWERDSSSLSLIQKVPRAFQTAVFAQLRGYRSDMPGLEDVEFVLRARKARLSETTTASPILHHEETLTLTAYIRKRIRYASGAGILSAVHPGAILGRRIVLNSARKYLTQLRLKGELTSFVSAVGFRLVEVAFALAYSHQRISI